MQHGALVLFSIVETAFSSANCYCISLMLALKGLDGVHFACDRTIEDTYLGLSQVQPLPVLLFVAVVDEAYISFSSESGN